MHRYKILIHCFNLDVPDEESGKNIIGFYATRYGSGVTEDMAFEDAKRKLKTEDTFKRLEKITKENRQKEPVFEIDEIEKVSFYSGLFKKKTGYVLYPSE